MNPKIRMAIVSNTTLMRQGLVVVLKSFNDVEVVFHAVDKTQTLKQLKFNQPDIILLSVDAATIDALDLLESLKLFPNIKTIILLDYFGDNLVVHFLEQAANAILNPSTTVDILKNVIADVYAQGFYYTADVMQVIGRRIDNLSETATSSGITTREAEILHLICQRKTQYEIAEILFISPKTVENHKHNLLRKSKCKNQSELRRWAARLYEQCEVV